MAVLKSEVRNRYTTIPNSVIREKDLSDGDYRLLIYLYSLPNGWKINQTYLGQELGCARENINKKLKRIKEAGYLEIIKASKENVVDYIYLLKEKEGVCQEISQGMCQKMSHVIPTITHINNDNKEIYINNSSSLCDFVQSLGFLIKNEIEFNTVSFWEEKKIDKKIIQAAIEEAKRKNKLEINYIHGIVKNLLKDNIKKNKMPVPEWLDKKIVDEPLTQEAKKELEELLKEFK